MKLTKEQITYIDDYLKHHKVKYWDIRIELLDHIVTSVEEKLATGISFDDAMIEVHKSFGNSMKMLWNSGIEYGIFVNSDGYKDLILSKSKETNKKYRILMYKELKQFFVEPINFIVIPLLMFLSYYFIFQLNTKVSKGIMAILIFSPAVLLYYYPIKMWFAKKREKSINLDYALFHAGLLLLSINLFFQLFSPKGAFHLLNDIQFRWLLVFFTPFYIIFNYCGFKMYKRTFIYFDELYSKLQSL